MVTTKKRKKNKRPLVLNASLYCVSGAVRCSSALCLFLHLLLLQCNTSHYSDSYIYAQFLNHFSMSFLHLSSWGCWDKHHILITCTFPSLLKPVTFLLPFALSTLFHSLDTLNSSSHLSSLALIISYAWKSECITSPLKQDTAIVEYTKDLLNQYSKKWLPCIYHCTFLITHPRNNISMGDLVKVHVLCFVLAILR